jgi:hypothetical protein
MKVRPACWRASASASSFFLRSRSLGLMVGVAVSHQEAKLDRIAEQGAQVVDRRLRELQVIPGRFHHIGEQFDVLTRLAHEFEDQEIKKTQGAQTLKLRRHAPRLSLLKNRRA